jgi:multiple sugar transport system substrate-binding protein
MGRRRVAGVAFAAALAVSCAFCTPRKDAGVTLHFWALGREGEVVKEMVPEFETLNPGIRVEVQQIPFINAHEKILTACVGGVTPDLAQVGNTWIPELTNLEAIARLDERLSRSAVIARADYFPGIWDTNVVDGAVRGIPWYVDTRLLFYRTDLLAEAGFAAPPRTWSQWVEAMRRIKARRPTRFAILLPVDEYEQPLILGRELGAGLLRDGDRYGDFRSPAFRRAAAFYVDLFRTGLAPSWSNSQINNVYQQFAAGDFVFYITGPWNIGEFRRRLPAEMQDKWKTAPMPAPDASSQFPGVSVAGGASLVLFRGSRHPQEAWKLVEFLSSPAEQVKFHHVTGDFPPRVSVWADPELAGDPQTAAFRAQLERVVPAPKIPEWEEISIQIWQSLEPAIRGRETVDAALTDLDRRVDRILEKRRKVLAGKALAGRPAGGR